MNPVEALGWWLSQLISWALELVTAVGPVWGAVIAFLAIVLETTLFVGLVVPGDTIVIAAATAVRDPLHFVLLLLTVILGTLTGQSLGLWIGRWIGPRIRASRLGRRLGPAWDLSLSLLRRRGGLAVFVSRFLPVLHALMPVTAGMSGMSTRTFLAWATPAAVIWGTAYVAVGSLAAESFRAMQDRLHWAGYAFAGVIVAGALLLLLLRLALRRIARRADPGTLEGDEGHPGEG